MRSYIRRIYSSGGSRIAIFLLFLVISAACSLPVLAATPQPSIRSDRFTTGDDLRYALPSLDDSNWLAVTNNATNSFTFTSAWRRIRFELPQQREVDQPAILLGRISDADELYLNGVKIGAHGMTEGHVIKADKVVRLYKLPLGLLKSQGENLLAVRMINLSLKTKLLHSPPEIGTYSELLQSKLNEESSTRSMEFVLFSFFFIWIEYMLFLYYKRLVTKEYISFGLFMIMYALGYVLDSLTFYRTGFKTATVQHSITALYFLLPATILYFQLCVFKHRLNAWMYLNFSGFVTLALAALYADAARPQRVLMLIWYLLCVSSAGTALVLAWQDYRQKLNESGEMLAGIVWLCLSGGAALLSQTTGVVPAYSLSGFYLPDLVLFVWIIIIKYGVISRFARIKKEMQELSSRLISAYEDERSRLARELHDGMGQNLVAIKFNLQRVNSAMGNRLINGVIEEISAGINELRDITNGLMPASLKSAGLVNTIHNHIANYARNSDICVRAEAGTVPRLAPFVELNVFRIFQEALNNAIKHSSAANILVSLQARSTQLVMIIQDDGRGFDVNSVRAENCGLGLSTMQERSRTINGTTRVLSGNNSGTTIIVEVPFS